MMARERGGPGLIQTHCARNFHALPTRAFVATTVAVCDNPTKQAIHFLTDKLKQLLAQVVLPLFEQTCGAPH